MFNLALTHTGYDSLKMDVDKLAALRAPISRLSIDELRFAAFYAERTRQTIATTNVMPAAINTSDEEDFY